MSDGQPGSSWARPVERPAEADSTRGLRLREILGGRAFAYGIVLGSAGAVLGGAWLGSPAVMAGGPVAVVVVALALAFATADRRSARDFFRAYAAARGLIYEGTIEPLPLTPLLGAGDRRRCDHWMRAPAGADPQIALGHYTYEVRDRGERTQLERHERHHFTISVTDLEAGIRMFPAIFLCRRGAIFGLLGRADWLSHVNRHEVELESARLCERYELWVDDGQDELLLRELFTPALEVLLGEHPLAPCFEYRAGTLLVYVERRLVDEGHLDWLRDVTVKLADRFTTEIAEANRG